MMPDSVPLPCEENADLDSTLLIHTVTHEDVGIRLDTLASALFSLTRTEAARLIADGSITVNGAQKQKRTTLCVGDTLTYQPKPPAPSDVLPENIPLDIVYEDSDLLVINKPSGMVVHPAPGNPQGTLVNALLYHCGNTLSGIGGTIRPGIVHRIDKDTSGLLVVAKNDDAHRALAAQLEGHHIRRVYHALVNGGFSADSGKVDRPIGRHPIDRKKMAVLQAGDGRSRNAVTHYRVLERFGAISYLSVELETGRTHQIRVHMSSLGHPLLGDALYGGGNTLFERRHASLLDGQCLHAAKLSFCHPRTKEDVCFEAPLPENFSRLLTILRQDAEK